MRKPDLSGDIGSGSTNANAVRVMPSKRVAERLWPFCRISSRWHLLWWFLVGRHKYIRVHGHDWHKETKSYRWWDPLWRLYDKARR